MQLKVIALLFCCQILLQQCTNHTESTPLTETKTTQAKSKSTILQVGAEQVHLYAPMLKDKQVALVVNQTSRVGANHLVDSLLRLNIAIQAIFSPEHGFRGTADAGEQVADGKDIQTGLPLISLYGKNKKPTPSQLKGIDYVLFDIQDVGARFYTYISTMHYVMEACAEQGVPFIVLDRPNPNGHYVDGPIRAAGFESFVGMHPIPIVHGMTIGEYATMLNGEGWLKNGIQCDLKVIPCTNYTHQTRYELPVKPSPNLPNNRSIYLYPSLCLFEGTTVSVGRGTNTQFQVYGHPDFTGGSHSFTPVPMDGAKYPKHQDKLCKGYDLQAIPIVDLATTHGFKLQYLIDFYQQLDNKSSFFLKNNFFDKLAGTDQLRQQILAGESEAAIRRSWQADLAAFKAIREKYLLYKE